jgi:hypothetical protein
VVCARLRITRTFVLLALMFAPASLSQGQYVERVMLRGAERTREATLLELLPREPPASYSDAELKETERRISNLGIFDYVEITRMKRDVAITVREKWTLIPSLELATGKTLEDLYLSLGATEYNFFGTATAVSLTFSREQRGLSFAAAFKEHLSRHHRFAYGAELLYKSSGLRFEGGRAWYDTGPELAFRAISPPVWNPHLRFAFANWYSYEKIEDVIGDVHPPSGPAIQPAIEVIWEHTVSTISCRAASKRISALGRACFSRRGRADTGSSWK